MKRRISHASRHDATWKLIWLMLSWRFRGQEHITRHGKPVARLIPNKSGIDSEKAQAASREIRARAVALKGGSFRWSEWKSWRDEGRP